MGGMPGDLRFPHPRQTPPPTSELLRIENCCIKRRGTNYEAERDLLPLITSRTSLWAAISLRAAEQGHPASTDPRCY